MPSAAGAYCVQALGRLLHSDEHCALSVDVSGAPHDLAAVGVIACAGVALNGSKGMGACPSLKETHMVVLAVPRPVVADEIARYWAARRGETVPAGTGICHNVRDVGIARAFDKG